MHETSECCIADVLAERRLCPVFQPVIATLDRRVCGYEGLIRGRQRDSSGLIPPDVLFAAAAREGCTGELDHACQDAILHAFNAVFAGRDDILLFLNINASVIQEAIGSPYVADAVRRAGMAPSLVVIEVDESLVEDTDLLRDFIITCRRYGFSVAFDDFGRNYAGLERITRLQPDIVKIDITLVRELCRSSAAQDCIASMVRECHRIGARVVTEGVETEEQALRTLELGVPLIQGFYYSPPVMMTSDPSIEYREKIQALCRRFGKNGSAGGRRFSSRPAFIPS